MKRIIAALAVIVLFVNGCEKRNRATVASFDGVPISYEISGTGSPALIFVHGWCCDSRYWKYQVPVFAKNYEVVTIDLAGHGRSGLGRSNWTIDAFGKDVAAVVNHLELNNVILIGHSLGGPVHLAAAQQLKEKVRGIVGVDTLVDFELKHPPETVDRIVAPLKADFVGHTQKSVRGFFGVTADPDLVDWVVKDMTAGPADMAIAVMQAYFKYDRIVALSDINAPIVCINSDVRTTKTETNQQYADSYKVKIIPGVGHFVMMEEPDTFNRLLAETIEELK